MRIIIGLKKPREHEIAVEEKKKTIVGEEKNV
jgi:hypothetical protein